MLCVKIKFYPTVSSIKTNRYCMKIGLKDFLLRLSVIIIATLSPFIYILCVGELPSISSYWNTFMQPMFIFINASTSYFLFSINKWRIPATLLLLLTAFSYDQYYIPHHVFAIAFFLYNIYPIYLSKKIRWVIIPYCGSAFLLFHSILYAEIFAIVVLCSIHMYGLIKYYRVVKKRRFKLKEMLNKIK